MDGWVDGWMDGWMGGWVDGWMGGWVDTEMLVMSHRFSVEQKHRARRRLVGWRCC